MVRVFSAYHYGGQTVHPVSDEAAVLASAVMDDDHLILAKSDHCIEIVSLLATTAADTTDANRTTSHTNRERAELFGETTPTGGDWTPDEANDVNDNATDDETVPREQPPPPRPTTLSFPTLDQVHRMLYCKQGNYIITLESDPTSTRQQPVVHCRVYTNWWSVDPVSGCYNTSIRARVADKVTPSGESEHCLDVIELPTGDGLTDPARQIACCSVSGNVCIASDRAGLQFYRFRACRTTDATRQSYIDFRPCAVTVRMPFAVRRLVVAENWVAAGNDEFVAVLRLVERPALGSSDDAISAATSLTEDGTTSVEWATAASGAVHHLHHHQQQQQQHRGGMDDATSGGGHRRHSNGAAAYEDADGALDLDGFDGTEPDPWNVPMTSDAQPAADAKQRRRTSASEYRPIDVDLEFRLCRAIAAADAASGRPSPYDNQRPDHIRHPNDGDAAAADDDDDDEDEDTHRLHHAVRNVCLKPMLQLRQRDLRDPFRCLSVRPIYMSSRPLPGTTPADGESVSVHFYENLTEGGGHHDATHSSRAANDDGDGVSLLSQYGGACLVGVTVLVATANDGYVYQFSSNDKWTSDDDSSADGYTVGGGRHSIATYPFTAPALDVQLNDSVLHALTDRGLETYTLRTGHRVFGSPYEYVRPSQRGHSNEYHQRHQATLSVPFAVNEACPRLEDPICLIGLRPFLGVRTMHLSDSSLVLLASTTTTATTEDSTAPWTVYHLRLPSAAELATDLGQLAAHHRGDSQITFALLSAEAHMVARVASEWLRVQRHGSLVQLRPAQPPDPWRPALRDVYLESCRRLGDCCMAAPGREDYGQAFGYYVMGELSAGAVLQRALLPVNKAERAASGGGGGEAGLVHTLKCMLLKVRHEPADMARTLAQPIVVGADGTRPFVDVLLELLLAEAPDEVAPLMLRSAVLRDAASAKWCTAIRSKQRRTPEDRFCLLWEAVRRMGDADGIEFARHGSVAAGVNRMLDDDGDLQPFDAADLYGVLVAHWPVLFDATTIKKTGRRVTSFSELTESYLLVSQSPSTQRAVANAFVHISVDSQSVGVEVLLRLLLDYLASRVGQMGYQTAQLVLTTLLEAHFYRTHLRSADGGLRGASAADAAASGVGRRSGGGRMEPPDVSTASTTTVSSASTSSSNGSNNNVTSVSSGRRQNNMSANEYSGYSSLSPGGGGAGQPGGKSTTGAGSGSRSETAMFYGEALHTEAIKILVRIYLGQLKRFELMALKPNKDVQPSAAMFKFMRQNLEQLVAKHQSLGARHAPNNSGGDADHLCGRRRSSTSSTVVPQHGSAPLEQRPILYADRRPLFLNAFPPFNQPPQTAHTTADTPSSWSLLDDARRTVFKLQALLCSGQLGRDVLQEIVYFAEANAPIAGLDGLLVLLLPDDECVDYLLDVRPDRLLDWAAATIDGNHNVYARVGEQLQHAPRQPPGVEDPTDQRWSAVLVKTFEHKAAIVRRFDRDYFESRIRELLGYLVVFKRLTQVIKILPIKCPSTGRTAAPGDVDVDADDDVDADGGAPNEKNAEEERLLTEYLAMAIDRDRAERLGEMIKTTGYQLYETYNRNKQFFN